MLTPDQIRLRLECVNAHESDFAVRQLLGILMELLPELASENARLRCALHLSELSRGVPSAVGGD